MNFFNTFRGRLLVILALLLIVTLSVQYFLNLRTQRENDELREAHSEALLAGFAIGVNGMTNQNDRLRDFVKSEGQSFYNQQTKQKIKDILIIDNKWQIWDSLSEKLLPTENEDGELQYIKLKDLKDLPPLMETKEKLGKTIENFPNANEKITDKSKAEAHVIPIQTSEGRWHIMVILENDNIKSAKLASQPLVFMLAILLLSTIITIFLVWRFSRPISDLSKAARRVASGDLNFRLKDVDRNDEIGQLAKQFNLMTEELEKTRELQHQLQEAEKSAVVGRLASAIAHEIRNPLNYINLSLDHLRNKFKPEDESKQENFDKLTSQLKLEVERINRQVSDFLRYSRPTKLDLQPINIRESIEDSLRLIEPQAEDQNIKISLIERENVPNVSGDAKILRSVFNNLLINATQAMEKDGGNLNIILSSEADCVKIEIKDTGNGIPEINLEKIFEPYFSTKETGTGLGLAIVKKIIDDHNGKIEVESQENVGTTFVVKLPKA
ncbi:MAG: ATP-binding protein [Acidobacteriota bacterium]|jgi:signal transduction histidine kinase|nr:ATP-binding protein [Acidobacteriota bacterium]